MTENNYDIGWRKSWRSIWNNPISSKPNYSHIWNFLLDHACYEQRKFIFNNEEKVLLPGQLLTGRKVISEKTGVSETTIERILTYLENGHMIGQQKTTRNRIITIVNWEKYQGSGQQSGQQMDNKRTTNGQQADTYKELEELEELKNNSTQLQKKKKKPSEVAILSNNFLQWFQKKLEINFPDNEHIVNWGKDNSICQKFFRQMIAAKKRNGMSDEDAMKRSDISMRLKVLEFVNPEQEDNQWIREKPKSFSYFFKVFNSIDIEGVEVIEDE